MTGLPIRVPHRPFAIAIFIRGSVIWIAVRGAMMMTWVAVQGTMVTSSESGGAVPNRAWAVLISAGVIALVAALVRLDLERLNERLFLANLGVRTGALTALAALPPLVLEAAHAALGPDAIVGAITSLAP